MNFDNTKPFIRYGQISRMIVKGEIAMILDSVARLGSYKAISPRFQQAIDFLNANDLHTLELGKYEIDGPHLFAIVQEYETKRKEDSIWEAHRKYADIQIVVEGEELLGHAPIETADETTAYKEDSDYALYSANGNYFKLDAGYFAYFAPHDVHSPCVAVEEPSKVRKVVIKVAMD